MYIISALFGKKKKHKYIQVHQILFVLFIALTYGLTGCSADNKDAQPNILFAISDDQGYPHASAYGCKFVETPGFDQVAGRGALFHSVYTAVPQCSPNRASILTGRYLWQNEEAGTHASLFPSHLKVFTDVLIEGGYHLGSTGKLWAPGLIDKTNRTKNKNLIGKVYPTTGPAEYWKTFETFLEERADGQPFFFWYGTYDPHRPYDEGSGIDSGKIIADVDVPPFLPDTEAVRSDFLDYAVRIERFDHNLLKMLEILEEKGELENTLVIVTSDNGMPFPRAKGNAYDAGVRVPMAACWGDKIRKGLKIDDLISHIDLAPTILDAANLSVYEEIEGKTFLKLLLNPKAYQNKEFRDAVFYGRERATSARPDNFGYPVRTIRTKRYELVWNMKPERYPVGNRLNEAEASRTVMNEIFKSKDSADGGYNFYEKAFGFRPEFELHDMAKDPYGMINLADDPDYKMVFDSLLNVLKNQLSENEDPRMKGRGDIWESYPRFMGVRNFGGEHPAYKGVYNDHYLQPGQKIPKFLFDTKDYQAFFKDKGISKEEYIGILKNKDVVLY